MNKTVASLGVDGPLTLVDELRVGEFSTLIAQIRRLTQGGFMVLCRPATREQVGSLIEWIMGQPGVFGVTNADLSLPVPNALVLLTVWADQARIILDHLADDGAVVSACCVSKNPVTDGNATIQIDLSIAPQELPAWLESFGRAHPGFLAIEVLTEV